MSYALSSAPNAPSGARSFVLRDLPLAARLVVALFLCSVGVGYVSALVNLHFQSAPPGELLPGRDEAITTYAGKQGSSQLERLLSTRETAPFNGQGSMRSALTRTRVNGWKNQVKKKADDLGLNLDKPEEKAKVEKDVLKDLDGERLSLILWARDGAPKARGAYDEDEFVLPERYKDLQITNKFVKPNGRGERAVLVKSIVEVRCARCHAEGVSGPGSQFPLDAWEHVATYLSPDEPTGMSLDKLALTTHVHLLGFSMLFGLTGLVFAFSSYPGWLRVMIAPLALLAQLVDISFWWLGRLPAPLGPELAGAIQFTGMAVAGALLLQILLSLFNLFGKGGKAVLVLLLAGALGVGVLAKMRVIEPYLSYEKGLSSAKE